MLGPHIFQRGYKNHANTQPQSDTNHNCSPTQQNPQHFRQAVLSLITEIRTIYLKLKLIVLGDFQYTVLDNKLHYMVQPQQPPPANILIPCLRYPLYLMSVIPTQYPTTVYNTWFSKSGTGRAGLDHILAAQKRIHLASYSGINHEILSTHLKSNHCLIYASFVLSCPDTLPSHLPLNSSIIVVWYKSRYISSMVCAKNTWHPAYRSSCRYHDARGVSFSTRAT